MNRYVIDASIILTSLLKEDPEVEAKFKSMLKKAQSKELILLSLKLLAIEVGNGLRFSVTDRVEALRTFKDFLSIPIKSLVLTKSQVMEAVDISYELGTTVYDTSYHVLAKAQNATFLTCDEDYYKKAKNLGDIDYLG